MGINSSFGAVSWINNSYLKIVKEHTFTLEY